MSSPIFIHVLSLDTVGGVESLYVHYLKEALARGGAIHYTCVSGKKPNPHFSSVLSQGTHRPFLEQYIMGLRVPKWLSSLIHIRRGMIEDLVKPTSWVFWNRIEDRAPPGHSIYYEHGASWTVPPTKKRKEFLHNCSTFIANSQAASLMLQKRWDIASPITVIPNPLRPDISPAAIPRSGSLRHPLRLGFIGRHVSVKAPLVPLHVLRELLEANIPATLSVAGVGPMTSTLHHTSKRLGIDSSISFCGCVSDVSSWFDSIDILLVPSIREPLGLVSLEAAARGVPVIAANVDGLPEVVSHEKTGLLVNPTIPLKKAKDLIVDWSGLPDTVVAPLQRELVEPKVIAPHDCVLAIRRLMEDPVFYSTCSAHAIELAQTRASFDSYYTSLKSILENTQKMVE